MLGHHNFKIYKVRRRPMDYILHAITKQHSGKITAGLFSIGMVAMLLTSFAFANAAPTADPPNSNVSPNFSSVSISNRENDADNVYSRAEIGKTQDNLILYQNYGAGGLDRNIIQFLKNVGIFIVGHQGVTISGETGNVNILTNNKDTNITSQNINLNGNVNFPQGITDLSVDNFETTNIEAPGTNAVQFRDRAYFHQDVLFDGRIGLVENGWILPDSRVSPTYSRTSSQTGTFTNSCPTGAFVMTCGYRLTGNEGGVTVTPTVSSSNRSCSYNYSMSASTGFTIINTSNVCYQPEFVGL